MAAEKIDKRKVTPNNPITPKRLSHMIDMRNKLSEKKALENDMKINELFKQKFPEKFETPEAPKEVETVSEEVHFDEEDDEEVVPKKTTTTPRRKSDYLPRDEIKAYVDSILPPELSSASRKKRKWEARKTELKEEILSSLRVPVPDTKVTDTQPKRLQLNDLFY